MLMPTAGLHVSCNTSLITSMPRYTSTGSILFGPNGGRKDYVNTAGRNQETTGCPVKTPTHLGTTRNMTTQRPTRARSRVEALLEHFVHLLFKCRRQGIRVLG